MVKANSLIEASYRLELYEQRLILLATTKEKTRRGTPGEIEGMITITAAEYANVFGVSINHAYEDIKKAVTTLFNRKVTIYADSDGKLLTHEITIHWVISQWIKKEIAPEKGLIKLEFHPKLEPYLPELKTNFSRYYLEHVVKMTSVHAIKLYELLIDWGQNFSVHTKEVVLDELKNLLAGDAVYGDIYDFKKYVLDIACKQINEFSDIECSYENKRTGRTITHIIFHFGRKPESNKPVKKEIAPVALPQEIKAIAIRLADQEDWQDLPKVLNLTGPYPILIKESRLISRQDNKLFIKITATAQSIWKTFKPRLEKTLSAHLGEQIEIILRTSSDEPLQRCNNPLSC